MMISRFRRLFPVLILVILGTLLSGACAGGAADPGTLVVLPHGPSGEVRFLQFGSGRVTDRVKVGGEPHHIVRDPARGRVYVTDRAGDSVAVIDVLDHTLLQRVTVGREPHFAALAPDGKRLYVTAAADGVLAIVDLDSLRVSARVPVGNRPLGLAVSADGGRVFVANDADETIAVVDPGQSRRNARPIPVPAGVHGGISLSSDGSTLLSGNRGRPSITAIRIQGREAREIALGAAGEDAGAPHTVFATPDGQFWLVGLAGTADVLALPTGGGEPRTLRADQHPSGFAVAPGGRVLVASRDGEHLVEMDLEKGKVTRRIRVGAGHNDLAVFSKASLDALRGGQ